MFPNGVGAPEYRIDPNALWTAASGVEIGQGPVNVPDQWGCTDSAQPPALTVANDQIIGPLSAHLANIVDAVTGLFGNYSIAMACNYNHFVTNKALAGSASQTGDVQHIYDSYLYPTSDQCSASGWKTYWTHVLNGLHYVQDTAAEQHQVGNRWCTAASPVYGLALAGSAIGAVASFAKTTAIAAVNGKILDDSCMDFIASGLGAAAGGSLDCDDSLGVGVGLTLPNLCLAGVGPACMGLERLIRHHCFYDDTPGVPRVVHCSGSAATVCEDPTKTCKNPPSTLFCEGELCLGGGTVDFTSDATNISVPYLSKWAHEWASTCGCGGHACAAPSVCQNCGQGDVCAPEGSQCCGTSMCSAGQECCASEGQPTCVTTGSCCGGSVCTAGQVCLSCGPDAGANDGGTKKDAGVDSTCPPAPGSARDAGGGTTGRQGTCVAEGTSCPTPDAGMCTPLGQPCTTTSECCPGPGIECGIVNGGGVACAQVPNHSCTSNDECSFGTLMDGGGIAGEKNNQCYDGGCCVAFGDCVESSDCCTKTEVCDLTGTDNDTPGCCEPPGAPCLQWSDPNVPGDCCGNQRCDPGSHTCVCAGTGANCWGTAPGCCNGTCPGDGNGCP
jgi:hypothetical protein